MSKKSGIGKSRPISAAADPANLSNSGFILWAGTSCGIEHCAGTSGGTEVTRSCHTEHF